MPKSKEKITFGNGFVPMPVLFPVDNDFKRALVKNQTNMKNLIGSSKILGMDKFLSFLLELPFNLAMKTLFILTNKITMTLSSAPGPKEPLWYGDYKIDAIVAFLPSVSDMQFGISMVSLGDVLQVSLISD